MLPTNLGSLLVNPIIKYWERMGKPSFDEFAHLVVRSHIDVLAGHRQFQNGEPHFLLVEYLICGRKYISASSLLTMFDQLPQAFTCTREELSQFLNEVHTVLQEEHRWVQQIRETKPTVVGTFDDVARPHARTGGGHSAGKGKKRKYQDPKAWWHK